MTDQTKKVMAGYAQLSDTDRGQLREKICNFETADEETRRLFKVEFENAASVGGLINSDACPCCGK